MTYFGLNGIFFYLFLILASLAFLIGQTRFYRTGLMFKMQTRKGWSKVMSNPEKRPFVVQMYAMFGVTFLCGLLALGSAIVGEELKNAPCHKACKEAGWEKGRIRSSPHLATVEERKKGAKGCWCKKYKNNWSEKAMKDL